MGKSGDIRKSGIDEFLYDRFGFSLEEAKHAVQEMKNEGLLNVYRDALGLWEEHTRDTKHRVIITLDGRDTAGKGSNITRVTKDLRTSRFETIAFPGIPTDEERYQYNWLERYQNRFPEDGELRFFDRSWYNRAFVEAAMSFTTEDEYHWFMSNVNKFEKEQIIDEGISFVKVGLMVKSVWLKGLVFPIYER